MTVPLFDLTRQNEALREELRAAADRVLSSGRFVLGEEVEAFEAEIAAILGTPGALAVSSGTDALLLSLMAAGVGPGDEVVVPDFTFFATAGCVARLGARPVFADVCPLCFQIRPESFAERIGERTKAVVPVHLFGHPADMDRIGAIAAEHRVTVVEDCAQSIGARFGGRATGTIGDFGAVSFFPTKNLGGFGDGGLLLARDPGNFERAKILRVHGMAPKYHHSSLGGNFRMDALQCALLRVKLPRLGDYNEARRRNAAHYLEALGAHPSVLRPSPEDAGDGDCPCPCRGGDPSPGEGARLILPFAYPDREATWNQFTVRIPGEGRRDRFRECLAAAGIGTEIYYPLPLGAQPCFAAHEPDPCPNAATVARECVSLPVFPELTPSERGRVVEAVAGWLDAG